MPEGSGRLRAGGDVGSGRLSLAAGPACAITHAVRLTCLQAQPIATASRIAPDEAHTTGEMCGKGAGRSMRLPVSCAGKGCVGALSTKTTVLLADEAPIWELDELRQLIADGQEKGFLTFEQIAGRLEEVDVTKEQVQELHAHLEEQGIDVVGADGRLAT